MPRVVHFDLSAEDPIRAKKFYEELFDWEITKWDGPMDYWLIRTGEPDIPGIDGGLGKRTKKGDSTTNTIEVDSVDEYAIKVKKCGGKIIEPKSTIPGVGYFVLCEDSEGNPFGIIENDFNV